MDANEAKFAVRNMPSPMTVIEQGIGPGMMMYSNDANFAAADTNVVITLVKGSGLTAAGGRGRRPLGHGQSPRGVPIFTLNSCFFQGSAGVSEAGGLGRR